MGVVEPDDGFQPTNGDTGRITRKKELKVLKMKENVVSTSISQLTYLTINYMKTLQYELFWINILHMCVNILQLSTLRGAPVG